MEKRILLLALKGKPSENESLSEYEKIFSSAFGEDCRFELANDKRALFSSLAQGAGNAKFLVVAVPKEHYLSVKQLLFTALGTKTTVDSDISDRILQSGCEYNKEYARVPVGATVLLSGHGLHSGFIEKRGEQSLALLPMGSSGGCDPEITAGLLSALSEPEEDEHKAAAASIYSAQIEECEENSSPAGSRDPEKVAEKLRSLGISVAVAPGKCSPFIFSVIPSYGEDESFDEVIYKYDITAERGEMSHRDHMALLAGKVRADSGATLGVSISNVFLSQDRPDSYFLMFCVADEKNARLLRIHSREGENAQEFIYACVYRLYSVLEEYADKSGFLVVDPLAARSLEIDDAPAQPEAPVEASPSGGKKGILTVVLLALLAIVLGVAVTFFVKAYSKEHPAPSGNEATGVNNHEFLDAVGDFIFADVDPGNNSEDGSDTQNSSENSSDNTARGDITASQTAEGSTQKGTAVTERETESVSKVIPTVLSTLPISTVQTTNRAPTAAPSRPSSSSKSGTFVFTVYGYGHGVGMSQNGAIAYASQGKDYKYILMHYYNAPGMQILTDSDMPETVSYNGKDYSLEEYISRSVRAEIGASAPPEALKAQAVAIYTYAKRAGFKMTSAHHAFNTTYNYVGTAIQSAVRAVMGEYLSYNGTVALTPYYSTSAGRTASSANVWGTAYPYLGGGQISPEKNVVSTTTISSADLKKKVEAYNQKVGDSQKISLPDDPAQWITVLSHDSAVNSSTGYVASMKLGNQVMRGNQFRLNIMGAATLRSHCFSFKYTPDK